MLILGRFAGPTGPFEGFGHEAAHVHFLPGEGGRFWIARDRQASLYPHESEDFGGLFRSASLRERLVAGPFLVRLLFDKMDFVADQLGAAGKAGVAGEREADGIAS